MYENPDTTHMTVTHLITMINYVKNQPLGATKQAGKACFVNMNVCILQKDSPT